MSFFIRLGLVLTGLLPLIPQAIAAQEAIAARVGVLPIADGVADELAWDLATPIITHDPVAGIDITLKLVHDGRRIAVLARFADPTENREHKTMLWDARNKHYITGPKREDMLVLKWSMESQPVDLSLNGEQPYRADIWFWKAARTDHAGFADDKLHHWSDRPTRSAQRILTRNGRLMYLTRRGDDGDSAYQTRLLTRLVGETTPRYEWRQPSGSRADIRAKGRWQNGYWTVEFTRKLDTGHVDDLQLAPSGRYLFGVSRYEIAGRERDPTVEQPDYGRGDIGEPIWLTLQ